MTKEQFDNLYLGKAVHCKTEELSDKFINLSRSFGYIGISNGWDMYKEETCYYISKKSNIFIHGNVSWYIEGNFDIVKFESPEKITVKAINAQTSEEVMFDVKVGEENIDFIPSKPKQLLTEYEMDLIEDYFCVKSVYIDKLPKREYLCIKYGDTKERECRIAIHHLRYRFKGLERNKYYTPQELGLYYDDPQTCEVDV